MSVASVNRAVKEKRRAATPSGLRASDLKYNKRGRVVSRRRSAHGRNMYRQNELRIWLRACQRASRDLNGEWPVPIKRRSRFYRVAKAYYDDAIG